MLQGRGGLQNHRFLDAQADLFVEGVAPMHLCRMSERALSETCRVSILEDQARQRLRTQPDDGAWLAEKSFSVFVIV